MKKNEFLVFILIFFLVIAVHGQSNNESQRNTTSFSTTQPISVTIGGDFIVTGSFPAYSGERLDQFITRIYNEALSNLRMPTTDEKIFLQMLSRTSEYALRGIKLIRRDKSERIIDLLRFRLSGDFENNPYLQNDDVIVFPSYDPEFEIVEINGAVKNPTTFQFVKGDKLSDALKFARGISDAYQDVNLAVISRLSYDGSQETLIEIDLDEEFRLQPGDRIKIKADQTKRKNYKILILGEVKNPGEIFITENTTTLKEAIYKAGGFTEKASLKDAELVRNFTRQQALVNYGIKRKVKEDPSFLFDPETEVNLERFKEILRMNRSADLFIEDTMYFNVSNELRILEGETRIDFTELDSANSIASEFIVKDGDVIIVPEQFETVYVFGQVANPGYFNYVEDKDFNYYLSKAGGLTITAKGDDDIYLIKGKGREWIPVYEDNYKIEPGDYLYALKTIPRDIWFYVNRIGTVAGILAGIATIVLLFK